MNGDEKEKIISAALAAFESEIMKLSCSNHCCLFNPPKGMGTNAGCSCLNTIRNFPLRAAIGNLHYCIKKAAPVQQTTAKVRHLNAAPLATTRNLSLCENV